VTDEKRHHDRISARVRVVIIGRAAVESTTVNVSRNGIFLQDKTDRPVNGVVRLRLFLPPDRSTIEVLGRVAWQGKKGGSQGTGIQFLNLDTNDRKRWLKFISEVENLEASSRSIRVDEAMQEESRAVEEERRNTPRTRASFMVRFRSKNRLEHFVTNNMSSGGMFLPTPVLRPVGERVQVVIIHPDTEQDFEIEAEVAHVNEVTGDKGPKGMGLKFLALSEEARTALDEFLKGKKD
jgi:uncharacterized protein (TIGR02266 family)